MEVNYNFEWDPRKAGDNRDKHGVAFDEAATVFRDSRALSIFDPEGIFIGEAPYETGPNNH